MISICFSKASRRRLIFWMPFLIMLAQVVLLPGCSNYLHSGLQYAGSLQKDSIPRDTVHVKVINATFLGNDQRNYYGNEAPSKQQVIWKHWLGKGITIISRKIGSKTWAGAGWTGQPLLVQQDSSLFLILGVYDHHLKKIRADSGKLVWQYAFDDVVKATGTLWENPRSRDLKNRLVIIQGSRLGTNHYLDARIVPSLRAISFFTGEELWRINVKYTDSYSRDMDGLAIVWNDTACLAMEDALFAVFSPEYLHAHMKDSLLQPYIYKKIKYYTPKDVSLHQCNVVDESSPSRIGKTIYNTAGSGHVYGYNTDSARVVWDFYIGSDIDGSPVVTSDSCLLVPVERQYIPGPGGLFKLDPSKPPAKAVIWFQPVANKNFNSWEGGIIGSAGINDRYSLNKDSCLAAVSAIDGYLYVVNHRIIDYSKKVIGPDNKTRYYSPKVVFKRYLGPSMATPVFLKDRLIAAGYAGLRLFSYDNSGHFSLLDQLRTTFESTPFTWNRRVYIASRDGWFYCLGEK